MQEAELVASLAAVRVSKNQHAAAVSLGISVRALRERIREAEAKGLTADTPLLSEAGKLRLQVENLKRENRLLMREADTAERIRSDIYGLASMPVDPPTWLTGQHTADTPGVPMVIWSDWHWGERVSKAQTGGVNEFNRRIGRERVQSLVDITRHLAVERMVNPDYPGIVVCLGGDFITGDIHEDLRETNEGTVQQCLLEVEGCLISALTAMADAFGKVFVPCVVGNHGRATIKPRAKNRVYTSYEWNLYCHLERFFKGDKRFLFQVPSEADAYFKVYNHRFLLTHGDSLGVKGGDGIIGAIGPIARGTVKVGRSEAQIGRDFDTLLMGHWHTYVPRSDAIHAIVNGSLIGYNEYARLMLRVPYSRPSQALWFVHPFYGITSQWPVWLDWERKSANSARWISFEQRKD